MQSITKPLPPDSSSTENVYDQGGSSGQLGLRAGGAKNVWVKKRHRKRVNRLKIATYNVSAILRYEHIQEVGEELREIRLVSGCNQDRTSEKTRGMFYYITKRPHIMQF